VVFLLGPTACGKSKLAMEVARKAGGEIVSLDAFQIYQGLDIGTAKPTRKEREEIPHHLLDIVQPEDSFSAAEYKREAEQVFTQLKEKRKKAIWVGGTGLYHRVMTKGLSTAPRTDIRIAEEIEEMSSEKMAQEVRRVDPEWAKGGDLKNRRRMVRALAVWRQTGRTISDWQKKDTILGPLSEVKSYVLMPKIKDLTQSIIKRVGHMLDSGWVEEVECLMRREGWRGSPGSRAIGYEEIACLIEGKSDRKEVCDKIVTTTRSYAKRQLTWFRGLPNFQPIEIDPQLPLPKSTVETLVTALTR